MRREAGFTLVELLVVLTIVGLGLAIAVPYFGKRSPGAALHAGVAEIGAALRAARVAAIAGGRDVAFRGDPAGGYWVDHRHYPLPATNAGRLRVATAGAAQIAFFPSGGSSGGRIFVDGPDGRREIIVDAITGRADAPR